MIWLRQLQPYHSFLNFIFEPAFMAKPASIAFGSFLPQLTRRSFQLQTCQRQQCTFICWIKIRAQVRHRKLPVQVPVMMAPPQEPLRRQPCDRRPLDTKDDHLRGPLEAHLREWARNPAALTVCDLIWDLKTRPANRSQKDLLNINYRRQTEFMK